MWNQITQALNQSAANFLGMITDLLPGLVVLILALLLCGVAAWILAATARRLLTRAQFDERVARRDFPSLADWSPKKSPTLLISRTIATLVILTGLLVGLSAFHTELTDQLTSSVFAYLPNVVGAVLVLLVGMIAARFLARSVLIGAVNMNLHYARLLSIGVKWLVLVLTVAMALEHLRIAAGIVELAFGILFGGIVLALALAVGLGSKDLVSRSLERDMQNKPADETIEEPLRHL